jgi:hypothetical protein
MHNCFNAEIDFSLQVSGADTWSGPEPVRTWKIFICSICDMLQDSEW